jgi:hypothetical protein
MKRSTYLFAVVVGQDKMKLALLLASVDWRLGILLRGDKGSGKRRPLAVSLPCFPHRLYLSICQPAPPKTGFSAASI